MSYNTLISTSVLAKHLDDPEWILLDARFSLNDSERGRRDYLESHIPGAIYVHLDEDLSGPIVPGRTGRHPLPEPAVMADRFARWGIGDGIQVVVYDDLGGPMAARAWWLLRWLGHDNVAVLDGGWPLWLREGRPVDARLPQLNPRPFTPRPREDRVVTADDVAGRLGDPEWCLVDSRTPDRYRGEFEPIDPVAGRIPGAINAPFPENLDPEGHFHSPEALRARFEALLEDHPIGRTTFYCGSGVSAAHNVLACAHAGLGDASLYAGSWSEWITDPARPIETG